MEFFSPLSALSTASTLNGHELIAGLNPSASSDEKFLLWWGKHEALPPSAHMTLRQLVSCPRRMHQNTINTSAAPVARP
jgi:hypothetical protein